MNIRQGEILRSLAAAFTLYFAYFCAGVLLDLIWYASIELRTNNQITAAWKISADVIQIFFGVSVMKLFVKKYNSKIAVALFGILLMAILVQINLIAPKLPSAANISGVDQALIAISICLLLLWKGRI